MYHNVSSISQERVNFICTIENYRASDLPNLGFMGEAPISCCTSSGKDSDLIFCGVPGGPAPLPPPPPSFFGVEDFGAFGLGGFVGVVEEGNADEEGAEE